MVGDTSRPSPTTERPGHDGKTVEPYMFLVLDGNYPRMPVMRHRLGRIDEVLVGRGRQREIYREQEGSLSRLVLRFPDPWMSSVHARIQCGHDNRVMTDPGSKNGSFINGVRQRTAVLVDGDLLQFGHTFFIYRDALPVHPADIDAEIPLRDPAAIAQADTGDFTGSGPLAHDGPTRRLQPRSPRGLDTLLGPLAKAFEDLEQIAPSRRPILILGEPGTGKKTIARAAHALSGRGGAFVDVKCNALPESLVHGRSINAASVSGEGLPQPGLLASAHGGTLFLDEIAALTRGAQAALLGILNESASGGPLDLRVIATTSTSIDALAARGEFSAELLAALSGYRLTLPPLRKRREDLGILVASLLDHHAPDDVVCFSAEAAHALLTYAWPRNVRELEACLRNAVWMRDSALIELQHLAPELRGGADGGRDPGGDTVDTVELSEQDLKQRAELIAVLRAKSGDLSATAHALGKARHQIQRWLERFDIDVNRFRE